VTQILPTKLTRAEWELDQQHRLDYLESTRGTPRYEPQYEVFVRVNQLRYRIYGERQDIEQIDVEPQLFQAAYEAISQCLATAGPRNPFPLPAPEREYEMWGVRVVKAA
jgi:hypothetical protein